jgi:large subunit ribosomal protein L35
MQNSQGLPFEQMPYQCFQEALKVLRVDRAEKIRQIETERARIARLRASEPSTDEGEAYKQRRLISMEQYLEKLKILADINDPTVRKRFEDKQGDMNRPIYRHLLDKKWRQYRRPLVMQRITQMHVVPDLLMKIDPTYDVTFAFGRKTLMPGQILPSNLTEFAPILNVQVFDKGERLVTVVVVDADVPDLEKDGFSHRCHYIATNIPISPTSTTISLQSLAGGENEVLPWLPPHSQKGSPYHRLAIFVLEQGKGHTLDAERLRNTTKRLGFNLRSFMDKYAPLKPNGVTMFRTVWDETMDDVMTRAGIEASDVEFKRTKIEALPYRTKASVRYR